MPVIDGKKYDVVPATEEQKAKIKKYLDNKAKAKSLYAENEAILIEMSGELFDKAVAFEVATMDYETGKRDEPEMKTFVLGNPKGQYVMFKNLDFVHAAKTIKADIEEAKGGKK